MELPLTTCWLDAALATALMGAAALVPDPFDGTEKLGLAMEAYWAIWVKRLWETMDLFSWFNMDESR